MQTRRHIPGRLPALLLFSTLLFAHPIHVSVCQISFSTDNGQLGCVVTLFSDDLELDIFRQSAQKLYLGLENQAPQAEALIWAYLQEHLQLTINGKPVDFQFEKANFSISTVRTTVSFSLQDLPKTSRLAINNRLLTGLYDDQKNLIRFNISGTKSAVTLNAEQPAAEINLK